MLLFLKAGTIFYLTIPSAASRRLQLGDGASRGPARLGLRSCAGGINDYRGVAVCRRDRQERAVAAVCLVARRDGRAHNR